MELTNGKLSLSREESDLDNEVFQFISVLESCDVEYVIVSGYVAILTGRSRATEDVDVIIEPLSETQTETLVTALKERGYWGMAMPLSEMYALLADGDRIRIAEEGELYPNFETWFASNEIEREAISQPLIVAFNEQKLQISPLELQIAYKLWLAQQSGSLTGKDFEDALHLYLTFEGQFNTQALEEYVSKLNVGESYDELKNA